MVAVIIIFLVVLAVYASRHGSDSDKNPPPRATLTDTNNRASMSTDARPGNTVQEDHDQNIHSQTPTVCVTDSNIMVIGRNDATFRCPPTEQEEMRGLVPIETGNDFRSFIHDYVIPTFCFQRLNSKGQQFAVLFLSKYDKHNIHKTQFGESIATFIAFSYLIQMFIYTDPHCAVCPRALVNPNISHFPCYVCKHLGNYIAARPDRNKNKTSYRHAEQFLLDKQRILIRNYTQNHGQQPQLIVLYSWLMPCSNCTTRIIKTFKNCRTRVMVVYTSHSQAKTVNMKRDKKILEQANITVIRVKYNRQLPPVKC